MMVERSWGLHSLAQSGQVELSLCESTDDEATVYELQVNIPSIELKFLLPSIQSVRLISDFLSKNYGNKIYTEIMIDSKNLIRFIKDDEYPDRFYIHACNEFNLNIEIVDPITSDFVQTAIILAEQISTE